MNPVQRTQIAVRTMSDVSLDNHLASIEKAMIIETSKSPSKAEVTSDWERLNKLYNVVAAEVDRRII